MVIQRWQSLLLFISLVLMSIFSVSNYATIYTDGGNCIINASSNTGYWIFNILIVLVLLIAIFLFKKLNVQKFFVVLGIVMMAATAIWGYNYLHQIASADAVVKLGFSWILLIVAFGLSIISFICIGSDQKLLKSYDRLR